MRSISLIAAALCVPVLFAQAPRQSQDPGAVKAQNEAINKQIDQLMRQGIADREKFWKKSSLTLSELGKRVARMTTETKGVYGYYRMLAQTSEGRGMYTGEMRFQQPNVFKVNWVLIRPDPLNGVSVANGKTRQMLFDGALRPATAATKPFSNVSTDPKTLVSKFSSEFPRLLFQGATDGKDAWLPLIAGWSKGMGGYKAIIQERSTTYQGKHFKSYRIKLDRNATAAKTLGASSVEIIFDGYRFLPTTVREVRTDTKGKPWMIQWSGQYKFDQKFKSDDFQMKGSVSKASP